MNPELGPDRFADFFAAVNGGKRPFPWQARLVRQLFDTKGKWPELLDLPTASGKTSTVDIALYTLAAGLEVPRRIVFVVDRRVIVQQAAQHARAIGKKLVSSDAPAVRAVAQGLRYRHAAVDEDRDCLTVAELRGAIQQDHKWVERADMPTVIASTVDQVGSRLLFRGYGVSDRMLPVHAGLLGNDALILLDEVHLARPFADLLRRIKQRYRLDGPHLPDRWQVVELSATPDSTIPRDTFELDEQDHAHPVLGRRLSAHKPTTIATAKVPADPLRAQHALAAFHADQVIGLLKHERVRAIGVVVNRVRLATLVHRELRQRLNDTADLDLLTGRMRGAERLDVLERVQHRVGCGAFNPETSGNQRKYVVVATQTIEAGADLDFDVIVTDCGSIDALIQRFGRVDRIGRLSASIASVDDQPRSVIIGTDRLSKDRDDPVYGEALSKTWEWLANTGGSVDFGISSGDIPPDRSGMLMPHSEGPILTRSHLDRLVRTSPRPDADVDVDLFLHGLDHHPDQDVEIVWRADISQVTIERLAAYHHFDSVPSTSPTGSPPATSVRASDAFNSSGAAPSQTTIDDLIAAIPPMPEESVSVPLSQVKEWLARNRTDAETPIREVSLSDMEIQTRDEPQYRPLRPCLIWRTDHTMISATSADLQPGDTIIVPAEYGGLEAGNWSPGHTTPVPDIAEHAALKAGQLRLRLNPATLEPSHFPGLGLPTSGALAGLRPAQRHLILESLLEHATASRSGDVTVIGKIPTPASVEVRDEADMEVLRTWLTNYAPRTSNEHVCLELAEEIGKLIQRLSDKIQADRRSASSSRSADIQVVTSNFGPIYLLSGSVDLGSVDSDPLRSCATGNECGLDAHLSDVRDWAQETLNVLGVGDEMVSSIVAAAWTHDVGKADLRFQTYLREGDVPPESAPLLAKSGFPPHDKLRNRLARQRSGYPRGIRHEVASAALAGELLAATGAPHLARFLVASHHGYGRPFFPPQIDPDCPPVEYSGELGALTATEPYQGGRISGHTAKDFADAVRDYGWWGLAWLEAVLRLADHGASRAITGQADSEAANPDPEEIR